ncbi:MAG: signal peptidase II [Acidobacteriota bacterium]
MSKLVHAPGKRLYLIVTIIVIALDQLTKAIISNTLYLHETRPVIDNLFNIVHTRNSGAVFGLLQDAPYPLLPAILTLLSLAALMLVAWFFHRCSPLDRMNLFGLSLILGGAVGNIIDRLVRGSVVDFLDFYIGSYRWPAFNVADSCICVGIGLLILRSIHLPAAGSDSTIEAPNGRAIR